MYNILSGIMPAIALVVIFYFLLVLPMKKSEKEHRKTIENLKIGNKIITSSGIIGTIKTINKDSIILKTANCEIEILKDSIDEKRE